MMQATLLQVLHDEYGIHDPKIEPAPRGFVAETYRVQGNGRDYFAKIIPVSRYSVNLKASLPVLHDLHRLGITQLTIPVPALDGRLDIELPTDVMALFEWIDEDAAAHYPFDPYAELIAKIHALSPQITLRPHVEDFRPLIVPIYEKQWASIWDGQPTHPAESALIRLLEPRRAEIEADYGRFQNLIQALQGVTSPFVVTHGDAPGNVVMDKTGGLHLIDWDDLLLAPAERDTWFHLVEPDRAERFLEIYRQYVPDYQPDERLIHYYLLLRYIEDLEGIFAIILDPAKSDETRLHWLGWVERDCFDWLRDPIRRFFP